MAAEMTPPLGSQDSSATAPVTSGSIALALTCSLIWAGQAVAVKVAVLDVPPFFVVFLRFAIAAAVLGLVATVTRCDLRLSSLDDQMKVTVNAILVFLQIALFTIGTGLTTTSRSIVIINTFPLFTALACRYVVPDCRIRHQQAIGLFLALAGLLAVFAPEVFATQQDSSLLGDTLVLCAATIMGLRIALAKRFLTELRPLPFVTWSTLFCAFLSLPVCFLFENPWATQLSWRVSVAIAYQGILVSAAAVLLWTILLSRHSPNDLTVFRLLSPALGVLFGYALMMESVGANLLMGCLFIVLGIRYVNRGENRPDTPHPSDV